MTTRSLLFAPAVRPDRFARAMASGSDMVCLDLEDAVPLAAKAEARAAAAAFVARPRSSGPALGIRMNALDSPWWEADLDACRGTASFVLIPKVASPEAVDTVRARVAPDCALWPMVETPEGLRRAWEIAAVQGVRGVVFGAFDYVAEVGCAMDWEPLLFARSLLAAACANARVELMDAPSGEITDLDNLEASTRRAMRLGFTARACIHPAQVPAVNAVFTPTPEEVSHAARVLAAFDAVAGGAAQLDGRLIELPVALAARRVLARAGRE